MSPPKFTPEIVGILCLFRALKQTFLNALFLPMEADYTKEFQCDFTSLNFVKEFQRFLG